MGGCAGARSVCVHTQVGRLGRVPRFKDGREGLVFAPIGSLVAHCTVVRVKSLTRRKPLDEGDDAATDLLERELESGVKIETSSKRGEAREDSVRSDLGGLLVIQGHIETHKRQS